MTLSQHFCDYLVTLWRLLLHNNFINVNFNLGRKIGKVEVSPKRAPRGKYRKSEAQLAKEALTRLRQAQKDAAKARRATRLNFAPQPLPLPPGMPAVPNTDFSGMVEINNANLDIDDPLAMPDPSLLDVSIKTEVLEDELPVPASIIDTSDPILDHEPDQDPIGPGLMISSVSGNIDNDLNVIGSPSQHSTSSMDIENNPIQDDPYDNVVQEPSSSAGEMEVIQESQQADPFASADEDISQSSANNGPKMDEEDDPLPDPFGSNENDKLANESDPFQANSEAEEAEEEAVAAPRNDNPGAAAAAQDLMDHDPFASNNVQNGGDNAADDPLAALLETSQDTSENTAVASKEIFHDSLNSNGLVNSSTSNDPFANCENPDEDDINALLQTNGDNVNVPTLLDEDANELLNQLSTS